MLFVAKAERILPKNVFYKWEFEQLDALQRNRIKQITHRN